MVVQVAHILKQRGVRLVFSEVSDHVRHQLDRSGVTEVIGRDAYFQDLADVAETFRSGAA
jgi:sulfate permease, SulP family